MKILNKAFWMIVGVLLLNACDNYEFPKGPYSKIETLEVTKITGTSVTFEAKISHYGDKPIINHGFIRGLDGRLLNSDGEKIDLGVISDVKSFETVVSSGLQIDQVYFIKSFVETSDYIVYGNIVSYKQK